MTVQSALKRMSVVIIDDSQRTRSMLATLMRDMGCASVCPFETTKEARIAIEKTLPSVVLCDWEMDDGNGAEFLDFIRCHPKDQIAMLPVIIVTGHGSRDVLIDAMKRGATQFLVKPIVPLELLKKMYFVQKDARKFLRRNGRMIYINPPPKKPVKKPSERLVHQANSKPAPVTAKDADRDVWEL